MQRSVHVLIALVLMLFPSFHAKAASLGEYSVYVTSTEIDDERSIATADVTVTAVLPSGDGVVHIPLPFVLSPAGRFFVEPNPSQNLVLFGDFRPAENNSIIQVSLTKTSSTLEFRFIKALIPLEETRAATSNKALSLLFGQAHEEAASRITNIVTPRLTKITVSSSVVSFSEPAGRRSSLDSTYQIELPSGTQVPNDITLYLDQQRDLLGLFFVTLVLGVPAGFISPLKFLKSRIWAWSILAISAVVLAVVIILVIFFPSLVRPYAETDIMLAFGFFVGILIGLIATSVYSLRTLYSRGTQPSTASNP